MVSRVLAVAGMHTISFLTKRQHLCAVAVGRRMFAHIPDMTAARFDILYCVYFSQTRELIALNGHYLSQGELRKRLGLARQTIAKGVKRLIELGLLEVYEEISSIRNIVVRLTKEGVRRFRQALDAAFRERTPMPMASPAPLPGTKVPRWWKRPELADVASIGSNGIITGTPAVVNELAASAIDPKFLRRVPVSAVKRAARAKASSAAHEDAAATHTSVDNVKREQLVYVVPKMGRDVERAYTSFVWKRVAWKQGRRGRRWAHLNKLEEIIDLMSELAAALGNTTQSIYTFDYAERCC